MCDRKTKEKIYLIGAIASIISLGIGLYVIFKPLPEIKEQIRNLECGQQFPFPVAGHVSYKGERLDGIEVTIKNLESEKSETILTAYDGEYLIDIANWKDCIATGDKIEINACLEGECSSKIRIVDAQHSPITEDIDIN